MWGFSYMGGIQFLIAATRPPHLKAIVPDVATIDQFFRHPNGVVWTPPDPPKSKTYPLDTAGRSADTPQNVDEDPDGVMLTEAVAEHEANIYSDQVFSPCEAYRNSYKPEIRNMCFIAQSAITYKDDIKASGADCINLVCPFCSIMYDDNQRKIESTFDVGYNIPVLFLPQLLGLAMGFEPRELGLNMNRVKPTELIAHI